MANVTTAPVCVECGTNIAVPSDTELGDILSCRCCGQEHEIIELVPDIQLDRAPEVEEDWGE